MNQCDKCQSNLSAKATFCSNCGTRVKPIEKVQEDYKRPINKVLVFFLIMLGYIILVYFLELGIGYIPSLLQDAFFAVIVLFYFFIDFNKLKKLFSFNSTTVKGFVLILIFAPLFALVVSFIGDAINNALSPDVQISYLQTFYDAPFPLLFAIISIGVFPAIFEEIACRGVFFNELHKVTTVKSSIFLSAILFTMLHLSLISILWIFPLGYLFGYLRSKYNTLWYGIIAHFVYNTSVLLIEYWELI